MSSSFKPFYGNLNQLRQTIQNHLRPSETIRDHPRPSETIEYQWIPPETRTDQDWTWLTGFQLPQVWNYHPLTKREGSGEAGAYKNLTKSIFKGRKRSKTLSQNGDWVCGLYYLTGSQTLLKGWWAANANLRHKINDPDSAPKSCLIKLWMIHSYSLSDLNPGFCTNFSCWCQFIAFAQSKKMS